MKILITGATGFIGRALILRLLRDGHQISAWTRDPARARSLFGAGVKVLGDDGTPTLVAALAEADAVVNLAGAPIAGGRFTRSRRQAIERSRIDFTRRLCDALAAAPRRPALLFSASAIGYYGDRGDELLDEGSAPGSGYLAGVCAGWERAAARASALGVRVVHARFGVVLGLGGGFLAPLLPLFANGLGPRLGDGQQFVSFIHLDDLLDAVAAALADLRYTGAINFVAPAPVRMGDLAVALAAALGQRQRLVVPAALLRLTLGEAAQVVLGSQRVLPRRLEQLGFRPRFPDLRTALGDLVGQLDAVAIAPIAPEQPPPASDYLRQHPPRYLLRQEVALSAGVDEVWDFFSRPENLALITPPGMSFRIRQAPGSLREGDAIDYSLRIGGAPLRWRSVIARWAPGRHFVDVQARGPYRSWWHEHHFRSAGAHTVMEDRVYYAPPFGLLGRLAQALFVKARLREVFAYRSQAIRQRFETG